MEIQNWKSMAGMAQVYAQARELGIETNLAELEAFGFTVVEPEKTGASPDFAPRLLKRLEEIAVLEHVGDVVVGVSDEGETGLGAHRRDAPREALVRHVVLHDVDKGLVR